MSLVCEDKRRSFYICADCELISVPKKYWLSVDDERARYDLHDNSVSNSGYVKFLSQVVDVLIPISRRGMTALDFGCGKEAILCQMLTDKGIDCRGYDPLYGRILSLPGTSDVRGEPPPQLTDGDKYDIIILCEVIEHVRDISAELRLINTLLRDNGIILIRTQMYDAPASFPRWWYAQDPTHINFFNQTSLRKVADIVNGRLASTDYPDIFIIS